MKLVQTLLTATAFLFSPITGLAQPHVIHIEWAFQNTDNVGGYRLYHENSVVCSTEDPDATSMSCSIDVADGESFFTLTSIFQDGTESPHSPPYSLIFSSTLKAIPTANIVSGQSPLTVTFDAIASVGDIQFYEWDFGDGAVGEGDTVTHTFTSAGTYSVSLEVEGESGSESEATIAIAVTSPSAGNIPPKAVISCSQSVGSAPLQVTCDAYDSSDTYGEIDSYEWNMGDGVTAHTDQITHIYNSPGTVELTLTVKDDGGLTDTVTMPIIVGQPEGTNIPPNAIISAAPEKGSEPLTVSFSAANSYDPDGQIRSYLWNFGDGTSGSGVSLDHSFYQDAVYKVTLIVKDNSGATSQPAEYSVTVPDTEERQDVLKVLPIVLNLLLEPSEK